VTLIAALVVAGAVAWGALQIAGALRASGAGAGRGDQVAVLLTLFAPALSATQQDPRAFLVWQPIATAARQLFPDEFARLDRAMGGRFPFSNERIEAAHAQWTADWLAWELAHDTEFKLKATRAGWAAHGSMRSSAKNSTSISGDMPTTSGRPRRCRR
jgi:hypothetical protein